MIEAMKQALDALEKERPYLGPMPTLTIKAITSLRQAIAKLESQEPVGEVDAIGLNDTDFHVSFKRPMPLGTKLYTHPPQRTEPESVQQVGTIGHIGNGSTTLTRAIAPLLSKAQAQAQPEQEPVAWRTFDGEGGYDYRSYEDNESYADEWDKRNPNHKGWVDKLYTPPPPCPTCEALARTVMMDQTGRDA
jgi:hypothetical protein